MSDRSELANQARLDLEELGQQVASGEIDTETASRLRRVYQAELERAEAEPAGGTEQAATASRSRPRLLVGGAILLLAFAGTVAVLGATAEEDGGGALQGVAAGDDFDPSEYSDETLEAVVASAADDPAVATRLPYMRFALAERYFARDEFQRAFTHYQAILEGDPPADLFASTMTRIAWITFVGNGEVALALDVIDRALEAAPDSTEALYVKGVIVWCGAEDAEAAVPLFERVASSDELDGATRTRVETDLAAAAAGEPCE